MSAMVDHLGQQYMITELLEIAKNVEMFSMITSSTFLKTCLRFLCGWHKNILKRLILQLLLCVELVEKLFTFPIIIGNFHESFSSKSAPIHGKEDGNSQSSDHTV